MDPILFDILSDDCAEITSIRSKSRSLEIPSEVRIPPGEQIYKIKSIRPYAFQNSLVEHVSFSKNSHIFRLDPLLCHGSHIKTFEIPSSCRFIHNMSLQRSYFSDLVDISLHEDNKYFIKSDDENIYHRYPFTMFRGSIYVKHFTLRESMTRVGFQSFEGNTLITMINIPSSLIEIECNAFKCCKSLKRVRFSSPSSVQRIGQSAFYSCDKLEIVTFAVDSKLEEISSLAFARTGIKTLKFPKSLKIIRSKAFLHCLKLTKVIFVEGLMLESIDKEAFTESKRIQIIKNDPKLDGILRNDSVLRGAL